MNSKGWIEVISKRDGRKCLFCGALEDLTVDHIRPKAMGGADVLENLRILCKTCHQALNSVFWAANGHLFEKPHDPCVWCGHGKSAHRTKSQPKGCLYKDRTMSEVCPCMVFYSSLRWEAATEGEREKVLAERERVLARRRLASVHSVAVKTAPDPDFGPQQVTKGA